MKKQQELVFAETINHDEVNVIITRTTQYFNEIQKNSNSEQHFDCFIESTFRLGCSHHQD